MSDTKSHELHEKGPSLEFLTELASRPLWRGRLHQFAFFTVLPFLSMLLLSATTVKARVAMAVYAVGLSATFGVSAVYHRWAKTERSRAIWQRADHATIFLGIAGTFTPICLLGVSSDWAAPLLALVALGAAAGIACALIPRRGASIAAGVLYIVVGWVGALALPALVAHAGWTPALLVAAGGVLYTVGAVLFARGVPRLSPRVFGYHEVWHVFTVLAASCHLLAVWSLANA